MLDDIEPGGVGIWQESWALGQVDSIRITDELGYGTDPAESIAVGWEDLKVLNAWKDEREYEICDVDKSGVVNFWDVRYAIMKIRDPNIFPDWSADVNEDGKIDQVDVDLIKKRAIEVALEMIENAASAAPSLQDKRLKIGA